MATYLQPLADFVCGLKLQDISEEIQRFSRLSTLDNIGVILVGHKAEPVRIAVDMVLSWGGHTR